MNSSMNTDPLAQLRDINLPDAVSYWPLAPGWLMLASLLTLTLLATLSWWLWRRSRLPKNPAYPSLYQAYQQLTPSYQEHRNLSRLFEETLRLAKCIAMARHGRRDIASLTGKPWLSFIRAHYPDYLANDEQQSLIADGLYRPQNASELSEKAILELKASLLTTMLDDLRQFEKNPGVNHRQGARHA